MGHDADVMFLARLKRQQSGFAYADEIEGVPSVDLASLERRGMISRMDSKEAGGRHVYVLTSTGREYQEGGLFSEKI